MSVHAHMHVLAHVHTQTYTKRTSDEDMHLKLNKQILKDAQDAFLFLFLLRCLEALGMVQCPTYCHRLFYSASAKKTLEPLTTGLFTFRPRRLGKHLHPHAICTQADFAWFVL